MSEVIAVWDKFDGGHWGNLGPVKAEPNQWGGTNVICDPQGRLAPISNVVSLTVANTTSTGQMMGMFYAWGADGRIYYLQNRTGSTTTSIVYRYTPDPSASQTITTVTVVPFLSSTAPPDWALVSDELYMTLYSNRTYRIAITGNTTTALTGTYGNAPAGRAIALYGERLVVGGVKDARFGNVPNRIVFSGDDTNNNPTDRTAWETLNYFDVGPPDAVITGLYATRDYLTVVMADQSVWTVTGVLGSSATARRMNGYSKGSGAVDTFSASHGTVDPSQTKVWMFDHATNGVQRFNGASVTRIPNIGYPRQDRTQSATVYGDLVAIGGPDEFVAFGVDLGAESGAGGNSVAGPTILVRRDGRFATANPWGVSTSMTGFGPNRVVANDRGQLILCIDDGSLDTYPQFLYWYVGAGLWDQSVSPGRGAFTDVPYFASGLLPSSVCSALLPYKRPQKTNIEWEIDGFLVDFVPRPFAASSAGWDLGTTTSAQAVTITGYAVGDGIPAFSRSAASATSSGVFSTSAITWSSTFGAGASDIWPNVRTAFFPARLSRVRAARVVLSTVKDARIIAVTLMGKQVPGRTA